MLQKSVCLKFFLLAIVLYIYHLASTQQYLAKGLAQQGM